jgi:copper(I)-binding protein
VAVDDRLLGIETPVAEDAELGGVGAKRGIDLAIPKGHETFLGEQGTFVRLLGLRQPLYFGRTYPMRLHFEHDGMVAADLTVDFGRFY